MPQPSLRLLWPSFVPGLSFFTLFLAIIWLATITIRQFYVADVSHQLETRALLLAEQIRPLMEAGDMAEVDSFLKETGSKMAIDATVLLPSGIVVADTDGDPRDFSNHLHDAEVQSALRGASGVVERVSRVGPELVLSSALPLMDQGKIIGVLKQTHSLVPVDKMIRRIRFSILCALSLILAIAIGFRLVLHYRPRQPVAEIKQAIDRLAQGDFSIKIATASYPEELRTLGSALNVMAMRLDEKVRRLVQQHNDHLAVLSSMSEGVIALDLHERVIDLNSAAERLLGIRIEETKGKSIYEVVRNYQLRKLIKTIIESDRPIETDVILHDRDEQSLQVNGTVLSNSLSEKIGVLIVFNDITRLKRLEQTRRDFVANVTHELRTPITSIKGFVETLLDGSGHQDEDVQRFHRIILKQIYSLHSIVEDLLQLSRLEQVGERGSLQVEDNFLHPVLADALEVCELKAREKKIRLDLSCPGTLRAKFNRTLVEQAVVNLVDNAINYSDPQTTITAEVSQVSDAVTIAVRDQGWGIERQHLSRVFERFYRVDKGRDRKLGGTGLGLAIVKHIALAHRGSVGVESSPGRGSTFSIIIPS